MTLVTVGFRLHGPLDIARFAKAVKTLGRHAALRSRYYVDQNQNRVQEILPESSFALEVKNVAGPSTIQEHFSEMRAHKYNLAAGESMRLVLYVLGEGDYFVVCGFSHISIDADGIALLVQEVNLAYEGVPLPTLGLDFDGYLRSQALKVNNATYKQDMDFWTTELTDSPHPPLLPPNKFTEHPTIQRLGERQYRHVMSDTLTQQIKKKCRELKSTPFHFYLSCVAKLIHQTTGSTDFTVNILDRNRNSPETETLVGLTRNELPLRFRDFDPTSPNSTCISLARDKLFKAIEHGSVPGEILEREFELKPLCLVNVPWMPEKGAKFCRQEMDEFCWWVSWGMHSFQVVILDGAIEGAGATLLLRVQEELFDEREGKEFLNALVQTVERFARED